MGAREAIAVVGIMLGLFTTIVGVWVTLDRRVTRLESMNHRMTTVESAVLQLAGKVGTSGEALAGIQSTVTGLVGRVESLEGAFQSGIDEVLNLLRKRDRRQGTES